MGNNRLQMNSGKIECMWILEPTGSRTMLSLVLDGITLTQTDRMHNLLDSLFLLED